jgi:hypothetical protein
MKKWIIIRVCLCLLSLNSFVKGQDTHIYNDTFTGVRIASAIDWFEVDGSGDHQVFRLVNKNHNLSVAIWKTDEQAPVRAYLQEYIKKQGMLVVDGPGLMSVDGILATTLCAECSEMRKPFKNLFLAVPGKSGILVIHFKCPIDCYSEHKDQIQALISSISLGQMNRGGNYYAHRLFP